MVIRLFKINFLFLACTLLCASEMYAQGNDEQNIEVLMRMVGHEVLLRSGDSTSRVLPIEKEENQYRIRFESDFQLDPDDLVGSMNDVLGDSKIADLYFVEVEECAMSQIVYSYKMATQDGATVIPCKGRVLPIDCYSFIITLSGSINDVASSNPVTTGPSPKKSQGNYLMILSLVTLVIVVIAVFYYFRKKRRNVELNQHLISIGEYRFNKQNMQLLFENEGIELTSKEADLLLLLHSSVNTTLDRDTILRVVWGDEGDYVGRTLDVYISKLRKKLEADSNVKILNARGVGYKLVLNQS